MEHVGHRAGTSPGCHECVEVAYEPSWYALLLRISEESAVIELETSGSTTHALA